MGDSEGGYGAVEKKLGENVVGDELYFDLLAITPDWGGGACGRRIRTTASYPNTVGCGPGLTAGPRLRCRTEAQEGRS